MFNFLEIMMFAIIREGNKQYRVAPGDTVLLERFEAESGSLADRVMAAMEAADEAGGDVRCTCETEPVPVAACHSRNAHVAYILQADKSDREGASFNDGDYTLYISATDEDIEPHENGNPVITLRMRYDLWKTGG